jgi:hypothetical protein
MSTGNRAARVLGIAQAGVGTAMVLAPRFVSGLPRGAVAPAPIVRVLGARSVGQGVVTAIRADRTTLALGAAVDITHLASMVALAAVSPRWRRTAFGSAALAAVSAATALALARSGSARSAPEIQMQTER